MMNIPHSQSLRSNRHSDVADVPRFHPSFALLRQSYRHVLVCAASIAASRPCAVAAAFTLRPRRYSCESSTLPRGVAGRVVCDVLLTEVVRFNNLRYDRPNKGRRYDGTASAVCSRPATAGTRGAADRTEPAQSPGAAGVPGRVGPTAEPRRPGNYAVARERSARRSHPPAAHAPSPERDDW